MALVNRKGVSERNAHSPKGTGRFESVPSY